MKLPQRVRSAFGMPVEHDLDWKRDEIYPYFVLEGFIVRPTPQHGCFTQPVNRRGAAVGMARSHANLRSALADLGWTIVD